MKKEKKSIRRKTTVLLLITALLALASAGAVSIYSLYSMKHISVDSSRQLGQTAAENAEKALEKLAAENLQSMAVERAAYIEEKFATVEAYALGIAALAGDIYEYPEKYPDREVALPLPDSTELAAQLLWSEKLTGQERGLPSATKELRKLGNIQDLLVQYNAQNDMVSSTYIATESGWMIQADYIAYSKYEENEPQPVLPMSYEAAGRQWYRWAKDSIPGQIIYTDVIKDIHEGGNCIVCATPVYYNGEVVAVAGVGSYLETVNNAVLNTTIGQEGYAFLVNEKGQVMVSGKEQGEIAACAEQEKDLRKSSNDVLSDVAVKMVAGHTGSLKLILDGREVYLAYAPLHRLGWSFVTVIDVAEVIAPAEESQNMILALTEDVAIKQNTAIKKMLISFVTVMLVVMLFICCGGTLFSRKLTAPIRKLTEEVGRLDGGNLDRQIQIATGDEVEELGNAFNKMTAQIKSYVENLASVTAEKERIRTEIQVASRLQADMLPKADEIFPNRTDFTLSAFMMPAIGVGGDFYDFFLLDEDRLALVMADVSGKGVPAALFMVVSRILIKSRLLSAGRDWSKVQYSENFLSCVVEEINDILCTNNKNGMFVTAWIGVLTLSTGELVFVNAGHCHPLICHKNGICEYNDSFGGLILAGMEGSTYKQCRIRLRQGDTLMLYTDGVTEATNLQKKLYGEAKLKLVAEKLGRTGITPEKLIEAVWKDVDDFQKGGEQFDDITLLAVTYHGQGYVEKTGKPDIKNIWEFADFVEKELNKKGVSMKTIVKILMAVDEIFSNICYYSGATEVTVGIKIDEQIITLFFEDNGTPYNPMEKPDPDVEELLHQQKEGGLGIYLVKKRMDEIKYEYIGGRNRLTISKNADI